MLSKFLIISITEIIPGYVISTIDSKKDCETFYVTLECLEEGCLFLQLSFVKQHTSRQKCAAHKSYQTSTVEIH